MHTIVVGVNYRTAPVEIREKLSFVETELPQCDASITRAKKYIRKYNNFYM